jgi:hypothetical protein
MRELVPQPIKYRGGFCLLLERNEYGDYNPHGGIMGRKETKKTKAKRGRSLREHEAFVAKRKLLNAFYFIILYWGVMRFAMQFHQ